MKKYVLLSFFAVLLTGAGCTTSVCRHYDAPESTGSSGRPAVAVIKGMNCGVFLFYGIPLWSGTPHRPNESEWDLWLNQVRERDIVRMLHLRAGQLGADDIDDVKIRETGSGWWSLWIFWRRTITGSCVAVKNLPAIGEKAEKKGRQR